MDVTSRGHGAMKEGMDVISRGRGCCDEKRTKSKLNTHTARQSDSGRMPVRARGGASMHLDPWARQADLSLVKERGTEYAALMVP